jgi:hypothetical protein
MGAGEALERQLQAIRQLRKQLAPGYFEEQGEEWSPKERAQAIEAWSITLDLLALAKPMFWTKEITEAVVAISNTLKLEEITAHRELLYCDHAFCWFEEPWMEMVIPPDVHRIHALTWSFISGTMEDGTNREGIIIAAYTLVEGVITPLFRTLLKTGLSLGAPTKVIPLGDRWDQDDDPAKGEALMSFAVAASMFLRQKLAVETHTRLPRHARKRVAALGHQGEPVVSVVLLRKRERRPDGPTAEHSDREYSYRWWVGGHVRQQYYPSLDKHLPILISPYIKGDDDKPLKPRTTPIFLINR